MTAVMQKKNATPNTSTMTRMTMMSSILLIRRICIFMLVSMILDNGGSGIILPKEINGSSGNAIFHVAAFSTTPPTWERRRRLEEMMKDESGPVVVVGKIIIDEYRSPLLENDDKNNINQNKKKKKKKIQYSIITKHPKSLWEEISNLRGQCWLPHNQHNVKYSSKIV
mmetsp:Transcript_31183/g.74999  ORF Transcript_31183/g.74999 Transcript_31183/m.74999 type:complete len:168 (-) Transcript_31183:12-515(-)